MSAEDAWQVEPRPVPEALTDTYTRKDYDPAIPHERDHITGWASFGEILGPEGVKALVRSVL